MTICFSIKKPNFIVTGTDVLAENTITHNSMAYKKFLVSVQRNFVVLISGSFNIDASKPEPRALLINRMDKIVTKNDTMLAVAKKLSQLINGTYSKTDIVKYHLQICGFDGKTPHIYATSYEVGDSIDDCNFCLSGAPNILDYGKTNEAKSSIAILKQMVPYPDIIQDYVRKFMGRAIEYENKIAKEKGEKPKTGGGINIVTVYPNGLAWVQPRYDSTDDPYKIGLR
ncbi:MAG: hypothetical protein ABSD92_12965 [Candidatus Bathyarchaeia archaeon]